MADFRNFRPTTVTQADASIDQGLRSYMLGVYNAMAIGLVITGIAAFAIASLATTSDPTPYMLPNGVHLTSFGVTFYTSPFAYVVMFAPLIAVFFLSFKLESLSTSSARALFFV